MLMPLLLITTLKTMCLQEIKKTKKYPKAKEKIRCSNQFYLGTESLEAISPVPQFGVDFVASFYLFLSLHMWKIRDKGERDKDQFQRL